MNGITPINRNSIEKVRARDAALNNLSSLSDVERVHFALALMAQATDPKAAPALHFASVQADKLSAELSREQA